jgi:hypothetical protein
MDPDANWEEQQRIKAAIKAGNADSYDRARLRELRASLREWIKRGGFPPKAKRASKGRRALAGAFAEQQGNPVKVVNLSSGFVILALPEGTTNAQAISALMKHHGFTTRKQMAETLGGLSHIGIKRD